MDKLLRGHYRAAPDLANKNGRRNAGRTSSSRLASDLSLPARTQNAAQYFCDGNRDGHDSTGCVVPSGGQLLAAIDRCGFAIPDAPWPDVRRARPS
jgi:hypothetical protein